MAIDLDSVEVRTGVPRIQTAEDARVAYLREEISEKELEKILAKFGQRKEESSLYPAAPTLERLDDSFRRTLPEEDRAPKSTVEERIKEANADDKEREKAARKAVPTVTIPAQRVEVATPTTSTTTRSTTAPSKTSASKEAAPGPK